MGRAARWLRSLFGGGKKEKEQKENLNLNSSERKERKRWSFAKSNREEGQHPASFHGAVPPVDAAWLRSYYKESEKEQNKHAIAVAAATAAAADAAVAAAQAAVAVVRLTSQGRGTMFASGRERWAAIKIQTVFRGYLAKKALRALRGLVKLQARVRGYLVRRQAAATLLSMQALMRAQETVRSQRARLLVNKQSVHGQELRHRKSIERFDDSRSEHIASIHSRRLSAPMETTVAASDESPKIVEIDTYRPKSRSRTTATSMSECGEDPPSQNFSSPLPGYVPARLCVPECRNVPDMDWVFTGDECRFSTAHSTPRFINPGGSRGGMPATPAKSVCADGFFCSHSNFPNYMANTQSFRAKLRSHSAPKQRPEPGSKKGLSLSEMAEARASLSGVRMQRSCSQVQENFNFKNAVVGRLNRSSNFIAAVEEECLQRRW